MATLSSLDELQANIVIIFELRLRPIHSKNSHPFTNFRMLNKWAASAVEFDQKKLIAKLSKLLSHVCVYLKEEGGVN